MQPQILREAADVIATLLSGVLESDSNHRFLRSGRKHISYPSEKKGKKEDPRNSRPICLTSIFGKVMEKTLP